MLNSNLIPMAPSNPARYDVLWLDRCESLQLPLFLNATEYQMEGKYFTIHYRQDGKKIKIERLFVKINNQKVQVGFN